MVEGSEKLEGSKEDRIFINTNVLKIRKVLSSLPSKSMTGCEIENVNMTPKLETQALQNIMAFVTQELKDIMD